MEANDDNLHPGKPVSYGFGWFSIPGKSCRIKLKQDTSACGIREAQLAFEQRLSDSTEDDGLTIIILCNRTDLDPEKLALKAASYYPPLK